MLDPRLKAGGAALVVGLSLGAVSWALAGGKTANVSLSQIDDRLGAVQTRVRSAAETRSEALHQALARPLFAAPAGEIEFKAVSIRLLGVVRTPFRTAALLSLDGGMAEWWALGQDRGGVVLERVTASTAAVSTPLGPVEVMLGQGAGSASQASDLPPAGMRGPPPPASAPGAD